ncbi:hypothetical protein GCM10027403_14850 [Arthrobacter tecti]
MVATYPTLIGRYSLLPPDFIRWTEADYTGDPLAHKSPIHRLTATELATVTVRIDSSVEPTPSVGGTVGGWAGLRLREHADNNRLRGRSSRDLARELRTMFFAGPTPRYPLRGFDVLREADLAAASTGVSVWIDAAPTKAAPYAYREMRFIDRLNELEGKR